MMLLNLGSGTTNLLPLLKQFGPGAQTYTVYNVDPADPETKVPSHCEYIKASAGALPFNAGVFDVVLAISPYGFSTVSQEVLRVLKPGGFIIVLGNSANKYVKSQAIALNRGDAEAMVEELTAGDIGEPGRIVAYLKDKRNYVSSTSGGRSETELQKARVWRKK